MPTTNPLILDPEAIWRVQREGWLGYWSSYEPTRADISILAQLAQPEISSVCNQIMKLLESKAEEFGNCLVGIRK